MIFSQLWTIHLYICWYTVYKMWSIFTHMMAIYTKWSIFIHLRVQHSLYSMLCAHLGKMSSSFDDLAVHTKTRWTFGDWNLHTLSFIFCPIYSMERPIMDRHCSDLPLGTWGKPRTQCLQLLPTYHLLLSTLAGHKQDGQRLESQWF